MAEITGFFTRDPETRRRVHMMVVREGRGEDLLGAEFELQRLPAIALEQMVLANERFIGTTVSSELHEFLIALETEGIEPLVPAVRIVERPPEGDIRGEIERAAVYRSAKIDGAAVFCADRLTGWLDGREARGAAWVRGQIQSTKLVIPHPGEEGEHASLRVTEADSRVQMQMKGGRLMARVTIGASADLVELTAPVDPFAHYRMWREMETAMAALIEEEVNEAVRTARDDFGADVFGFGRQLARQDPEVWRGMERDWAAQFSDLTVHVRVEAEIRESGLLMRAPRPGTGD